jgi:hypothetical protein
MRGFLKFGTGLREHVTRFLVELRQRDPSLIISNKAGLEQ